MEKTDQIERLWTICERFGVIRHQYPYASSVPPFALEKANLHDSKAEFSAELTAVNQLLGQAEGMFNFLVAKHQDESPDQEVATRLSAIIDDAARSQTKNLILERAVDAALKTATDVGLSLTTIYMLVETIQALKQRKRDLLDQEVEFWSLKSRAPNYYARTIALGLARLVARSTGKKPTVGTARDGGHPSTDFSRALEEVFQVLAIGSDFKRPAQWAVDQLNDDDLRPHRNALADFIPSKARGAIRPGNAFSAIVEELSKGREQ